MKGMNNMKGYCNFFLLLTLVLSSCGINNKKSYLNSFEDFVVDIEACETITSEQITSIKKTTWTILKLITTNTNQS